MAILRSLEGTFYEIEDSELDKYKVPPEKVKSMMEGVAAMPQGPRGPQGCGPGSGPGGQSPQIIVQFITQGAPAIQGPPPPRPQAAEGGEEEKVEPQQFVVGWGWANYHDWHNWSNYHHWHNWRDW